MYNFNHVLYVGFFTIKMNVVYQSLLIAYF